ncbi:MULTISPECIES: SseB family protein [Microbacterium]|uniref:SseB family protein n=1 Tax=Microbacterium TaxID=33882 RepID=UPI0030101D8C
MGLFSRRKKQDDVVSTAAEAPAEETPAGVAPGDGTVAGSTDVSEATDAPTPDAVPEVAVSVQAFRGLGSPAGHDVSGLIAEEGTASAASNEAAAPSVSAAPAPAAPAVPAQRRLPLAPVDPPAQTESIPGMKDNVLLREALAELEEGASNEVLLGVLRQTLQGHLFLRVQGDAGEQLQAGKPLSVGIVKDGENTFMLAFSSASAVRDSVQLEQDPAATSAVVQPVQAVLQQVVNGPFAGLIIDNASAPHRVVLPREVLAKALEQADPNLTLKTLLAAPREADSEAKVGEALATARFWVAVSAPGEDGQFGVAEARAADGSRFLQVFSHPLEVVALARGDQPMPFSGEQIGKVLAGHPELTGVIVDPAGPTIAVRRDALGAVLALAEAPAAD